MPGPISAPELHRRLLRAFLAPLVLVLLMALALAAQIMRQRGAAIWVDHTDRVIADIRGIEKLVIDLETGFRGFLLSGRQEFLEPYDHALGSLEASLRFLRDQVKDDQIQVGRIDAVEIEVRNWVAYAQPWILQVRRQRSGVNRMMDFEGKRRMDALRARLAGMIDVEERLRAERRAHYDGTLTQTLSLVFGLALLAGLVIALLTRRQLLAVSGTYARTIEGLRREEEENRALLDGVRQHGIALLDERGAIITWSSGAERLTGLRHQQVAGKPLEQALLAEGSDAPGPWLEEARHEGRAEREAWARRADGTRFWADLVLASLFTSDGSTRGYSLVFRDHTRRHELESERDFLLAKLKEAVAARDEFLSTASHELKTPLTSLMLQLESARRRVAQGGPAGLSLERIESLIVQTSRIQRLVESMLDLARLHSGRLPFVPARADLGQIVERVITDFSDDFTQAGCPVELEAEPGVIGDWDPFRVEQVVINFISNALQHGRGKPIRVSVVSAGGSGRVSVSDLGPGIPPEMQASIFERFSHVDGADHHGGLGLGLYLSRQATEAQGGRVWVESQPGERQGATFHLELPLHAKSHAA